MVSLILDGKVVANLSSSRRKNRRVAKNPTKIEFRKKVYGTVMQRFMMNTKECSRCCGFMVKEKPCWVCYRCGNGEPFCKEVSDD